MDLLHQNDNAATIDALAQNFSLSRADAQAVVDSVLPEISHRIERNTLSRGGVADTIAMLGSAAGHDPLAAIGTDDGQRHGNALLEQIFGNRDASRAVAARASLSSGIGSTIIQAMLPYIASMVMRQLSRKMSGGLGDLITKIPNLGGAPATPSAGRPPMSPAGGSPFPAQLPRGGGVGLPGPDGMQIPGRNPYGDLSDVIRRGGSEAGTNGSPLWRIVRNVLGSALGFQSRGVVSWIVRMVFLRYGWGMLRTILQRVFMRR